MEPFDYTDSLTMAIVLNAWLSAMTPALSLNSVTLAIVFVRVFLRDDSPLPTPHSDSFFVRVFLRDYLSTTLAIFCTRVSARIYDSVSFNCLSLSLSMGLEPTALSLWDLNPRPSLYGT